MYGPLFLIDNSVYMHGDTAPRSPSIFYPSSMATSTTTEEKSISPIWAEKNLFFFSLFDQRRVYTHTQTQWLLLPLNILARRQWRTRCRNQ